MAFADPPYNKDVASWDNGFVWQHDWLEEVADYVFVTPGTSQIGKLLKDTEMQYRWLLTCGLPGVNGRHSAIGTSNTIQVLLFSALKSVHLGASDYMTCSYDQTERFESTHLGRKPSALMAWLIDAFSSKGDVVLDPFLGSGTTLLMCESLGRICYGCELEPSHCESIIARWEAMTGQQAQLLNLEQPVIEAA
jgi:DNA modification methylase